MLGHRLSQCQSRPEPLRLRVARCSQPVPKGTSVRRHATGRAVCMADGAARRGVLVLALLHVLAAPSFAAEGSRPGADAEKPPADLIGDLLKKSKANKEMNDRSRLDNYNRKNFKDYFNVEIGSPQAAAKRGLSPETIRSMQQWLEKNK